jgi:hypothetical protein
VPPRRNHLSIGNVNLIRLLCLALATSNYALAAESRETFDRSAQLPDGWQNGITGQGRAKWEVISEQSAPSKPNVLRQSGEATFAKQNIRINAVAPGAIATEMWGLFAGDELRDQLTSIIPVGRVGASEEIAAAVLYLCSDNAKFTTCTSLVMDGGFIAQ